MAFDQLAHQTSLNNTVAALTAKGYQVTIARNKAEALKTLQKSIPAQASLMNGASVTLEQIGFVDLLKTGKHPWNNLHAAIVSEKNSEKQAELRRQALLSEYYLGSVHALTETGEMIIASNTGSQLPHIVFSSPHLIFVVSSKKIVPTVEKGLERLEKHVIPLENGHMQELYGVQTQLNKIVIFKNESAMNSRTVHIVLVEEDLGF